MILAGLVALPLWTAIQQQALFWFAAIFDVDTSRIRIEASIARLLLFVWSIVFIAAHARNRIARLWRRVPLSSLPVIAGSLVLVLLFVGLLSQAGINVFFRSMSDTTAAFPSLYLEDGLMENLTVIGFAVASLCLFHAALRMRRSAPPAAIILAGLALGGLVIAGEEVSWGQRIFGWESSQYFSANNVQDETNLHNLLSWNIMAYMTMLAGAALALVAVYADEIVSRLPIGGLPIVMPTAAVRISLLILTLTFSLVSYNELSEEIVSWIFLCYAISMLCAGPEPGLPD